ncbi:MAG: hypothetical protein GY714_00605, partial [Desulfobacterales bacterium]|nr:hypothetical protein [Desulfobacterales bacterium]
MKLLLIFLINIITISCSFISETKTVTIILPDYMNEFSWYCDNYLLCYFSDGNLKEVNLLPTSTKIKILIRKDERTAIVLRNK